MMLIFSSNLQYCYNWYLTNLIILRCVKKKKNLLLCLCQVHSYKLVGPYNEFAFTHACVHPFNIPLLVCGPYSKTGFSHFNVDLSSSVRVLFKMHASAKPYRSVYDCFFPRLQCQKYPATTTCSYHDPLPSYF